MLSFFFFYEMDSNPKEALKNRIKEHLSNLAESYKDTYPIIPNNEVEALVPYLNEVQVRKIFRQNLYARDTKLVEFRDFVPYMWSKYAEYKKRQTWKKDMQKRVKIEKQTTLKKLYRETFPFPPGFSVKGMRVKVFDHSVTASSGNPLSSDLFYMSNTVGQSHFATVPAGSGIHQRSSDVIHALHLSIKGVIYSGPDTDDISFAYGNYGRILRLVFFRWIAQDKRAPNTKAFDDLVLQSAGTSVMPVNKHKKIDTQSLYSVLKDKKFYIPGIKRTATTGGSFAWVQSGQLIPFELEIPLDFEIRFDNGANGTNGETIANGINCFQVNEPTTSYTTVWLNSRFYYLDQKRKVGNYK